MAYFSRRGRRLSAFDTFQPIAMLVAALVEMNLVRADDAVKNFGIARGQRLRSRRRLSRVGRCDHLIPSDKNPTLCAIELDPVRKITADVHGHAVGVNSVGKELAVDIPQTMGRELRRTPNFKRPGVLRIHTPVGRIHVVCTPSRDHARAELLAAQPSGPAESILRVDPHLGVINLWCGTEPRIVIQVRRDWHRRSVWSARIPGQADFYMLALPDTPVAH